MKFPIDSFEFRFVVALIAVPATAFAFIGLAKLKDRVNERRVLDYVHQVQPQLAADPRFKYVKLERTYVSGCVSNSEVLASLKSFLEASKPPVQISFSLVSTNPSDLAEQEDHERFSQLQDLAMILEKRADALFTREGVVASGGIRLIQPKFLSSTNELAKLADFEAALAPLTNRTAAIIRLNAMPFDINDVTNAASLLKECGFKDVRTTVMGWGMIFPGPTL